MTNAIKKRYTAEFMTDYYKNIEGYKWAREAARAKATKKSVGFDFVRGDIHMHTLYSDGKGNVDENWEVARARGLDFIFVTDHGTVRQKVECKKHKNVWWGQEPGGGPHHICILGLDRKFTPTGDMKTDAKKLREMGLFFFYPHPTGWFPRTYYSKEQSDALAEVGNEFAIEVMNGIMRSYAFHEKWEDMNVALWDRYLCDGYRVIGLGATDAHFAHGVGNTWTGLIDTRLSKTAVLRALRSGRVFASSGPAIDLNCGKVPMGGGVRTRKEKIDIVFECADDSGLNWAEVVQDGKVKRRFDYRGKKHAKETVTIRPRKRGGYVRVQCAANDDRRAYSNPIYFDSAVRR